MSVDASYWSAIHQIIRTGHWLTDQVGVELKEFGISEPQYNVLRILKGRKGQPANVNEILCDMVQRTSNVTRIVDKLLEKGLVDRQECPTNRRKMDITLTQDGDRLLKRLDHKVRALHKPMAQNLTMEESQKLAHLISKLKGEKTT